MIQQAAMARWEFQNQLINHGVKLDPCTHLELMVALYALTGTETTIFMYTKGVYQ